MSAPIEVRPVRVMDLQPGDVLAGSATNGAPVATMVLCVTPLSGDRFALDLMTAYAFPMSKGQTDVAQQVLDGLETLAVAAPIGDIRQD